MSFGANFLRGCAALTLALAPAAAWAAHAPADTDNPSSDNLIISPAHGWVLPIFTPDGYRSLILRGDEVRLRRNDRIDLQDVTIILFSGTAAETETTLISSPEASYFRAKNLASGPTLVFVQRFADNSQLSGADWTYQFAKGAKGAREKLIIRRDARVVLQQQIHDFLQ